MKNFSTVLVIIVAVAHLFFLILEMFLWETDFGRNTFGLTVQDAHIMAPLAANQGLYNGFLAVGLIWALITRQQKVIVFLLLCVIVAGIYGAITVKLSILFFQALPAVFALILMWLARNQNVSLPLLKE